MHLFVLTRFRRANRFPLRFKTLCLSRDRIEPAKPRHASLSSDLERHDARPDRRGPLAEADQDHPAEPGQQPRLEIRLHLLGQGEERIVQHDDIRPVNECPAKAQPLAPPSET